MLLLLQRETAQLTTLAPHPSPPAPLPPPRDANVLLLCVPHQFVHGIMKRLAAAGVVPKDAIAISLTKVREHWGWVGG